MKLAIAIAVEISLAFLSPIDVGAQKGWKTYTVDDEFSFKYPSNWKLQERENRFTTIDATLKYGNNDVHMVFEGGNISELGYPTDNDLLSRMEGSIEERTNGKVFESGLDKNAINNRTAPYAIGTYTTESLFGSSFNIAVLATFVHVSDDEVVLVRYMAEQNDFDKYLPRAKEVIKSITPIDSMGKGDLLNQGTANADPNSVYRDKYCPPLSLVLCEGPHPE